MSPKIPAEKKEEEKIINPIFTTPESDVETTVEEVLLRHGVTKEYLLRKAKLYYILHSPQHFLYCHKCKYKNSSEEMCMVNDWRDMKDGHNCLLKFLPGNKIDIKE